MAQHAQPKLVVGLGELLWDLLPSGAQLGGTVSNFAVMAGRLGSRAVCASDSARFDVRFSAVADGGSVTGNWQESTRNVGGTLQGQIANGAFEGTVSGGGLTLQVSYRTNGRALMVEIGINAGGIDKVEVSMRHGG